jgi:secondary thiamine-phosphate synthase enzyme
MDRLTIEVDTSDRQWVDLTEEIAGFCDGLGDGLLNVFAQHSTVGLAIAQPDDGSTDDIIDAIQRVAPREHGYHHELKSPGHGADHLTPVVLSPDLNIPVDAGVMAMGPWQRVLLFDFDVDSPVRRVRLSFLASPQR